MLNIPKDFKEFIRLLNKNNVKYLIVGGYAVAYHGYPRFTGDIDFFLEISNENASAVLTSLNEFGFESLGIIHADLMTPDQVIQLGYPPLRIDLLTSIDGVTFEQAWKNRILADFDDIKAYFISKNDLTKNKNSTGRLKDQADAEELN